VHVRTAFRDQPVEVVPQPDDPGAIACTVAFSDKAALVDYLIGIALDRTPRHSCSANAPGSSPPI